MGLYFLTYEWILNKLTLQGERFAIMEVGNKSFREFFGNDWQQKISLPIRMRE